MMPPKGLSPITRFWPAFPFPGFVLGLILLIPSGAEAAQAEVKKPSEFNRIWREENVLRFLRTHQSYLEEVFTTAAEGKEPRMGFEAHLSGASKDGERIPTTNGPKEVEVGGFSGSVSAFYASFYLADMEITRENEPGEHQYSEYIPSFNIPLGGQDYPRGLSFGAYLTERPATRDDQFLNEQLESEAFFGYFHWGPFGLGTHYSDSGGLDSILGLSHAIGPVLGRLQLERLELADLPGYDVNHFAEASLTWGGKGDRYQIATRYNHNQTGIDYVMAGWKPLTWFEVDSYYFPQPAQVSPMLASKTGFDFKLGPTWQKEDGSTGFFRLSARTNAPRHRGLLMYGRWTVSLEYGIYNRGGPLPGSG